MTTGCSVLTGTDILYDKKIFGAKTVVCPACEHAAYYAAGWLFARGTEILIIVP